jgi:hypothetical protein
MRHPPVQEVTSEDIAAKMLCHYHSIIKDEKQVLLSGLKRDYNMVVLGRVMHVRLVLLFVGTTLLVYMLLGFGFVWL